MTITASDAQRDYCAVSPVASRCHDGRPTTPAAHPVAGGFRLGARIYDLKQAGHKIHTARVETPNGARVASYSLAALAGGGHD